MDEQLIEQMLWTAGAIALFFAVAPVAVDMLLADRRGLNTLAALQVDALRAVFPAR